MITTLLASALLVSAPAPSMTDRVGDEPGLAVRLARLREEVEQRRELLNISGLSLAVVVKDEVVFAEGFGLRDREGKLPAEANTVYAIGSTTKAFTSMLCAMLVDEGKLDWDARPATWLPWFAFKDATTDKEARLRDLLAHRTGLTRTDVAWLGTEATREQLMRQIARSDNFQPFGKVWQYNNTMFLVAGEAAAKVAGKPSWDELLEERILQPLHMERTTSRSAVAAADPLLSKRYDWNAAKGDWQPVEWLSLDSCAPAGAICSDVLDMAKWVRFLLRKGEWEGRRLVSAAQVDELWRDFDPNDVGPSYGLGWFLHEKDGQEFRAADGTRHRVVEHGGNVPGYAANVALLPSHDAGLVLLTNTSQTQLQSGIFPLVFSTLFGPWKERREWVDGTPLPKETWGKWLGPFTGGMEGRSNNALTEQGGRLTLVIPPGLGQQALTVYTLGWPDADGRCWLREEPESYVVIDRDDAGNATALTLTQGYAVRKMKPVVVRNTDQSPDVSQDEFFAKREAVIGGARAAEWKTLRLTGTLRYPNGGVVGTYLLRARGTDALRIDFDASPFGAATTIVVGDRGTVRTVFGGKPTLSPDMAAAFLRANPIVEAGAWIDWTDDVELKRVTYASSLGSPLGGPCYEVIVAAASEAPVAYYVSATTWKTVVIEGAVSAFPGARITVPIAALSDWRDVGGVQFPFKREFTSPDLGACVLQIDTAEVDVELDEALFSLPAAEATPVGG